MFGLPFLNGRIPIGRDNMGGQAAHNITGIAGSTLGGTGGSESVSLVEGNMPSHSHSIDSFTEEMHFANGSGVAALARSADTEQTSSIGTGTPFVTLPPYQVVNYIIYTGVM
jgi:microcystin-dependent protein